MKKRPKRTENRNTGFKKNMKEMENQKEWIRNGGGTFKD